MFLRRLLITKNGETVRDIAFHEGMNLIVDETPRDLFRESGNNVGKTTVLRLVSYCFGGEAEKIYSDPEFKDRQDPAVKTFLEENDVVIEIRLAEDLALDPADDVVIARNFLKRRAKILVINGVQYRDDDFARALKSRLFDDDADKPTVKQIVAKNIREGSTRTENAIQVLDSYTTAAEYEALFLFWLGVTVPALSEKQSLETQAKAETTMLKRLNRQASESQVEQALMIIERRIADLERTRASLNINPDYNEDFAALTSAQAEIAHLTAKLGAAEMRRSLLVASVEQIGQEQSGVDAAAVRRLYHEARALIPGLQRSFEETLAFHNAMVNERIQFLRKELPELNRLIATIQEAMARAQADEARLAAKLKASGSYADLERATIDLYAAHQQKGQYEERRRTRRQTQKALVDIQARLDIINSGIVSVKALVEQRITDFNVVFAQLSSRAYGEEFLLSADWSRGPLRLNISSVGDNLGTGKKLGQIALFDLAYMQFADAENLRCLHFAMQDRMENVHDNQLLTIGAIVREMRCQYILTILRDKLPDGLLETSHVALTLSQDDKLFRIP